MTVSVSANSNKSKRRRLSASLSSRLLKLQLLRGPAQPPRLPTLWLQLHPRIPIKTKIEISFYSKIPSKMTLMIPFNLSSNLVQAVSPEPAASTISNLMNRTLENELLNITEY